MSAHGALARWLRPALLVRIAALALVYAVLARLALRLDAVNGFATLVWPGSGIALVALIRGGGRLWPGVALGAFLANVGRGAPWPVVLAIVAGNTLEALAGAALVRRVAGKDPSLGRLRDALALVFGAATLSTVISASVGVGSLMAAGLVPLPHAGTAWLAWWLGDASGDVVLGALLLLRRRDVAAAFRGRSRREVAALALMVVACGWLVFGPSGLPPTHDSRQGFLLFPVLLWAAMRLRAAGAALIAFLLTAAAIAGTALGYGPFVDRTLHESLVGLQAFVLIAAGSALLLGASKSELESSEGRASFLARTGAVLAGSLDYETTLDKVARLAVPYFADWCIVDVVEGDGIKRVAVAAADPDKQAAMLELRDRYPPDINSPQPAGQALRSGQPYLKERFVGDALAQTTRDERHFALMKRLAPASAMALPLSLQGRIVGAITFAQSESGRRYRAEDLVLGEEIARRAAMAVENARLHRQSEQARLLAEAQRAKLEWWERAFEHAGWGVALTEAQSGLLSHVNPAFARMHGFTVEEMVGQPLVKVFAPECVAELRVQARKAEQEGRANFESVHVRRDGTRFPVSIDVVALTDQEGRLFRAANVIDITERRAIEDERARLLESEQSARGQAERASRAKDEFLAMLGHELRNPLSPIVTALQLMRLRGDPRVSSKEHEVIERQVRHLVRLVDDLLDVSRITRGKIALRRAPVEIAALVAKAVETAGPLLEQRKHMVELDVPRAGLRVLGDEDRLAQVLTNLLTNAAKYTPPEGRIRVSARREGDEAVLRVSDNGVGLAPDLVPVVFDLFVQGPRSPERAEGGLGIGLALVRSLVQLHGGTVAAASAGPDRGSEFVVRLPLLAPVEEPPPAPAPPAPRRSFTPRRVLIVDDNRDVAEATAEVLREVGHDVTLAFDPIAALSAAGQAAPEVAILDLGLPVMDGYELAQKLRERSGQGSPRLIALTGYGQESDRARTSAAGFAVHLVKPVDVDDLLQAIEAPGSA